MRVLAALVAPVLVVAGQAPAETPGPGSPLRRAVLDALRPSIERRLGGPLEFVVTDLRVADDWAFVQADPRRRDGRPIDGAALFPETWETMDGLTVTAVLRRRGGRWTVVESGIGETDAWYCGVDAPALRRVIGCDG